MSRELHSFRDIPVPIEVRIGHRTASVQDLASIKDGSIFLLDKPAGETLDLYVGNIKLASVEVVVVEDRLSVRITEFESSGSTLPAVTEGILQL
jgi:flagellar motor switch protein FliN/FliY